MWIPIALILGLLVATAVIAHVSDTLGKRLGKKRVSVFGLRPRHSATVLTVASSWGIMGFTMLVLLGVYAPLKNAIFHYERERAGFTTDRARFATEQANFTTERARFATERANFIQQIQISKENLASTDSKLKTTHNKLETAQEQIQTAQGQVQRAQSNLQAARSGEQRAQRGAQAAQKVAQIAQISARKSQTQQQVAQRLLNGTRNSLQMTEAQLGATQTNLDATQKRLASAHIQVTKAHDEVKRATLQVVASKREELASYTKAQQKQREVDALQGEVDALQATKRDLQKQVTFLREAANGYRQLSEQLAFGDIRLPADQTLAERRFDATRSPDEIARELRILVDAARGAARGILVNDKLDFFVGAAIADKSGTPIELNEAQAIELYSNVLSSANQTISARLVSAFNYPSTTTIVAARFVFIPIHTIYTARENVAEATIDTNKTESAIFRQLQDLIELARRNAVKRGANPPLSPESLNFFDGDTGQKLLDTLHQIQKVAHPVSVRVVAARDLDSAEPLQVRFVVGEQT